MINNILGEYVSEIFSMMADYLLVVLIILLVLILLGWILSALSLSKMNKALNQKNSWMGWVPILNIYLFGSVAYTKPFGILLTLISLSFGIVCVNIYNPSILPINLFPEPYDIIIIVLFMFFILISIFKIYRIFSKKAWIMMIFTILTLGLLIPIFMFFIKNNAVIESKVNYDTE